MFWQAQRQQTPNFNTWSVESLALLTKYNNQKRSSIPKRPAFLQGEASRHQCTSRHQCNETRYLETPWIIIRTTRSLAHTGFRCAHRRRGFKSRWSSMCFWLAFFQTSFVFDAPASYFWSQKRRFCSRWECMYTCVCNEPVDFLFWATIV